MLEKEISRRTLLKVIAAGCGVVVASSLPREWVKPVIDAGVLPVHAQTTSGGTITGFLTQCDGGLVPAVECLVTVDGTSPELSGLSDINGEYTISGVPAGTYALSTFPNIGTASGVIVTAGDTTLRNIGATGC
jgi:hypothetical protein